MTKKDLIRIIREVVRKEVKTQVDNVLTEMESQPKGNMTINEAMDQTEPFPTMKSFTGEDARAGFAAMQTGYNHPLSQTDINGKQVDVSQLEPSLNKALTRDYSSLVKKMNK